MTTLNYLAYGSNLSARRLAARISIRGVVGTIVLPGYRLAFNKRGADGSGKCNLQPCPGERAHGVVYQIEALAKSTLDRIEGVGHGYRVDVWRDASHGDCFFYRAEESALDDALRPFDWYHAYVLAGARQHALPLDYIAAIAAVPTQADDDARRRAENFARLGRDA